MSGERGATLLEVLIALAITAIIAASVTQMTGFGLRTVERAERRSVDGAARIADERRLRDTLALIEPQGFAADDDGFTWRGPGPSSEAAAWRLSRDGRIAACDASGCGSARQWIASQIGDIEFAGSDGVFLPEWRSADAPHLIRIGVADGEVVIAPRARGFE